MRSKPSFFEGKLGVMVKLLYYGSRSWVRVTENSVSDCRVKVTEDCSVKTAA